MNLVGENQETNRINIVNDGQLWKLNGEPMHESDRINPPWDIIIGYHWWHDEKTGQMMNIYSFLTNGVSSIDLILDYHI